MGHAPKSDDMRAVYREKMRKGRLLRVANRVQKWLFKDNTPSEAPDVLVDTEAQPVASAEPTAGS